MLTFLLKNRSELHTRGTILYFVPARLACLFMTGNEVEEQHQRVQEKGVMTYRTAKQYPRAEGCSTRDSSAG